MTPRIDPRGGAREHGPPTLTLEVGGDLVLAYRREAARRGVPVRTLICSILDTIAADRLVDAVLDDREA
jgi:hypothetical protein